MIRSRHDQDMAASGHVGRGGALALLLALLANGVAHDGPHRTWLESLQRPDNDRNPWRQLDPKSLFCCGEADIVRTKFKVENTGGRYPEDRWYAWLDEAWTLIPPEKILAGARPERRGFSLCTRRRHPVLRPAQRRPVNRGGGDR